MRCLGDRCCSSVLMTLQLRPRLRDKLSQEVMAFEYSTRAISYFKAQGLNHAALIKLRSFSDLCAHGESAGCEKSPREFHLLAVAIPKKPSPCLCWNLAGVASSSSNLLEPV